MFKKGDQVMGVGFKGSSARMNKQAGVIIGSRKIRTVQTIEGPQVVDSYLVKWHNGEKSLVPYERVMKLQLCTDDDAWADEKVSSLVRSLSIKTPPGFDYGARP
jgi:hypothetical protein